MWDFVAVLLATLAIVVLVISIFSVFPMWIEQMARELYAEAARVLDKTGEPTMSRNRNTRDGHGVDDETEELAQEWEASRLNLRRLTQEFNDVRNASEDRLLKALYPLMLWGGIAALIITLSAFWLSRFEQETNNDVHGFLITILLVYSIFGLSAVWRGTHDALRLFRLKRQARNIAETYRGTVWPRS